MKGILAFLFPALMVAGLMVSMFVIVTALQAAELPGEGQGGYRAAPGMSANDLVPRGGAAGWNG